MEKGIRTLLALSFAYVLNMYHRLWMRTTALRNQNKNVRTSEDRVLQMAENDL